MSAKKDTLEKQLHLRHRPGPDNPNCFGMKTRFSSIESQPKEVVVVIIVGHKNLTLKFGKNWVNNK